MSKFNKIQQAAMTGTPIEELENQTKTTSEAATPKATAESIPEQTGKAINKNELNTTVVIGKKKPTSAKKTVSILIEEQNAIYLKKKAKSLNHSASSFINELLTSMRHNEE